MSRLNKLVPLIGSLLLSKGGRRVAGRHAGKLALATLAYEVWRNRREAPSPRSRRNRADAGAAAARAKAAIAARLLGRRCE